jgi:murein DD-endopeptidase MepM/ murein hydrolase activator NlpD
VAGGGCSDCEKKKGTMRSVPLEPTTTASTEPVAGHDFSSVRTHSHAKPSVVNERGGPLEQDMDPMGEHASLLFPSPGARSSTLPYRESIELSDCLRIMGDKNMDYCLEAVPREKSRRICSGSGRGDPLSDMSTFQSPGGSGWWGAKFGCYRNGCKRRHKGWDIHAAAGTPILAVATGNITHHKDPGGLGEFIKLRSLADPTREYWYGHLSAHEKNGFYCVGNTIGKTGTTGNAGADRPHLHLEIHVNGAVVDPGTEFTEPANVIEATGTSATVIDKTLPEPCAQC